MVRRRPAVECGDAHGRIAIYYNEEQARDLLASLHTDDLFRPELERAIELAYPGGSGESPAGSDGSREQDDDGPPGADGVLPEAGSIPAPSIDDDVPRPSSLPARGQIEAFDAGWDAHRTGIGRYSVVAFSPSAYARRWALLGYDCRVLAERQHREGGALDG